MILQTTVQALITETVLLVNHKGTELDLLFPTIPMETQMFLFPPTIAKTMVNPMVRTMVRVVTLKPRAIITAQLYLTPLMVLMHSQPNLIPSNARKVNTSTTKL